MSSVRAPAHDDRWGDHVPWSLRYTVILTKGDYRNFLQMLSQRLYQLFRYNEPNLPSLDHFGSRLETESLLLYKHNADKSLAVQIRDYFLPYMVDQEAITRAYPAKMEQAHWNAVLLDRLEVLQSVFYLLAEYPSRNTLGLLLRDIGRFAADSGIMLSVKGNPPTIVPLEEPLMQQEVLDKLLPRLEKRFPERAKDLTNAYHDFLKGVDANTIFGNTFKALEELAREISGNRTLKLSDRAALENHFGGLHGTIRETIVRLSGHRGDEGAHGRKGPDEWEIRYLLLAICNIALLLVEYSEH
jgi:hypothetical protein